MKNVDLTITNTFSNKCLDIMNDRESKYNFTEKHFDIFSLIKTKSKAHSSFNILRDIMISEIHNDKDLIVREFPMGSLTKIKEYREYYKCEIMELCERCGKPTILNECLSCNQHFKNEEILNRIKGIL